MNHHIEIELDKRYQEWEQNRACTTNAPGGNNSIMDLIISEYIKTKSSPAAPPTHDPEFKKWAIAQLRLFLFVGHDSTAITISYALYLSKLLDILAKLRAEHDEIFGALPSTLTTLDGGQNSPINPSIP
ncbi:hypothetical protein BDV12DRAFT_203930 [Aspergillus spectabilis]